jgi:cytoskeletal protein CcmA (bactofilin family)
MDSGASAEMTVIARADRFEGTLKVSDVLRVLGSAQGQIETTTLFVEEVARVAADVVADEVVISGDYEGTLTCRQRLEVRPSGRISGHVETARLMLHEGAEMDGDMKMLRQPPAASSAASAGAASGGASAGASRPAGVRSATDTVRSGAPGSTGSTGEAGGTEPAVAPLPPGAEPIG